MYVKAKETHCPLIICGILQYWSDNKKKLYKKCISDKESIYDADLLYKLQLLDVWDVSVVISCIKGKYGSLIHYVSGRGLL